ncbi:MAG: response regulator transcription factor [Clostridia bacterium]|nr:response regulator transcription factor [Clostridia bacterium]
MYNVLICDDEADILRALNIYLSSAGYRVFEARNGREALDVLHREKIHLALLDVMMPEMDGLTVIQRIREEKRNLPIILLTAKSESADKVAGLDLGADDYVTKPFDPQEVIARSRSQIRRYTRLGAIEEAPNVMRLGGVEVFPEEQRVCVDGDEIRLTPIEYNILCFLMRHPGQVFSSRQLYEAVWQEAPMGSQAAVAVHIRHLREKLEIDPSDPRYLKVVWGRGYRMEEST